MSTGTKVAIGAAAGAAVIGAGLAATSTGRHIVKKATGAARDLKDKAVEMVHPSRSHRSTDARGSSAQRGRAGKPRGSVVSLGGGPLGAASIGGQSLGGRMNTGLGGAARPGSTGGFESRQPQRISAKVTGQEAIRGAVRGHSGHR